MTYILIVFYATVMGVSTNFTTSGVRQSTAVVMQEFNSEQACKAAMQRVMQAGASADCLPKGIKK